ncbi:MAG TPA: helix-turn-helix transcriptional regulator [Dehalococcoidia bacterium]|nr:helix-turn-helix transcriptional regulator [Dehalococcoidia bacterium]
MRRGRPRHDDVLTPREWEVLSLLREGLTNEQIAGRLGITFDTAKFHVAEILGKLGVETRQQAAAWQGRPRPVPSPAGFGAWLHRVGQASPLRIAAGTVIVASGLAMLGLAGGLVLMYSRDAEPPPAETQDRTGDEALDALIDSVLTGDAPSLASRFAGVTAREGSVIGGPVGIAGAVQVASDEWTARLAASTRELYGVVRDPIEPYEWNQFPPLSTPRASVYAGARDYDVLLIVDEPDRNATPWRLSVLDGQVVDLVIDGSVKPSPTQGPLRSGVPLITRMAELMPNPENYAQSFAVLPPEDRWPPPFGRAPSSPPGPADVSSPAFAPNGRTGRPEIDKFIDALTTDGASELSRTFAGLAGRETRCEPDPNLANICNSTDFRVPLKDWTARLASSRRSLYAVSTGDAADISVVLAVDAGGPQIEAWRFGFTAGQPAILTILPPTDPAYIQADAAAMPGFRWNLVKGLTPQPASEYERFFVLPPKDQLPQAPTGYALSNRTNNPEVDAILATFESRDAGALSALLLNPDGFPVRTCSEKDSQRDIDWLRDWARDSLSRVVGLDSVVNLPEGYQPPGDHLILLNTQTAPYRWSALGIVERQGRIVGLLTGDDSCGTTRMYPPAGYILPPPVAGAAGFDPLRRSGVAVIDDALDAAQAGDAAAMASLIVYEQVECGMEFGAACPVGVAKGTQVDAVPITFCEGGYETRDTAPAAFVRRLADAAIYAIAEDSTGDSSGGLNPGSGAPAVMTRSDGSPFTVFFNDAGITGIAFQCGFSSPDWLLTGTPNFLLPPK